MQGDVKSPTAKKRRKALKTRGFQCFEKDIDHNQNKARKRALPAFFNLFSCLLKIQQKIHACCIIIDTEKARRLLNENSFF